MKIYEKRPEFRAVQFDGSTASVWQMDECGIVHGYTLGSSGHGKAVTVDIGHGDRRVTITIQHREWLVCDPNGNLSAMTSDQIRERFEQAEA